MSAAPATNTEPSSAGSYLWAWLVVATGLVVLRTLPYVLWGTLAFDGDQAVVGLMSKHIAEFRALPVYQYGMPYVVMVSAYVIAPFMWVFGATLFALKLPLLLMNVAVGLLLIAAAIRTGLTPAVAVVVSLPVLLTSAVTNASLMDALGMTVEPLLFVLLLWYARRAPVLFGVTAALGFHVREFVAYGVAALLVVEVVAGELWSEDGRRRWLLAGITALGTTAALAGIARYASIRGPDTWIVQELEGNLATLGGAFCFVPRQAWRNVHSQVHQGAPGVWPVFAVWLVVVAAAVLWRARELWQRRHTPRAQLGAFLMLVGGQAAMVYAVSRCGSLSVITIRYALLAVFLPTGLALLAWSVDVPRVVRQGVTVAFVAVTALNGWVHVRIWQEQLAGVPLPNRAQLAHALEARGIRYARSDYWTAYYVDFISQERVTVGADVFARLDLYERVLAQHAHEVVRLSQTPCGDEPPIVPGYHVCRDNAP
jgi:hypothetical protein